MRIPFFQVDAFSSRVFSGNPAAVCPLRRWEDEALLQQIAAENNLSETAFFVPEDSGYRIRWFTPVTEVDLCGHATLASAWVIFTYFDTRAEKITFLSRSGPLTVHRDKERIVLDFPAHRPEPCPCPSRLLEGLGTEPRETLCAEDYIVVLASEQEVTKIVPRLDLLRGLDRRAMVVTAAGANVDFVSRCFAPGVGINEDPVTGSSHCALVPYWSGILGKKDLTARQLSKRGGELFCSARGERVLIAGEAVLFLEGTIVL